MKGLADLSTIKMVRAGFLREIYLLLIAATILLSFVCPARAFDGVNWRFKDRGLKLETLPGVIRRLEEKKPLFLTDEEQVELLVAYRELTEVYAQSGEFSQARESLSKSINYAELLQSSFTSKLTRFYSLRQAYADMAALLIESSEYDSAEKYLYQALQLPEAPFPRCRPNWVLRADLFADLAVIAHQRGDARAQRNYWNQALNAWEDYFKDHQDYWDYINLKCSRTHFTDAMLSYAHSMALFGQPVEAENLMEKTLELQKSVVGYISEDTWDGQANFYGANGNIPKQNECHQNQITSAVTVFGKNSLQAARALYLYACFLAKNDDFQCSAIYLRRAINYIGAMPGKYYQDTAQDYECALREVQEVLRRINREPPTASPISHSLSTKRAVQSEDETGFACSMSYPFLSGCNLTNPVQRCMHQHNECEEMITVIKKVER